MSNFTTYPRQDLYETALATSIDATQVTGTVETAPDFTLSSGSLYGTIDPTGTAEIVEITGVSGTTLTWTRGLPLFEGAGSSASSHAGGVPFLISNTWNTFDDIQSAITTKLDTDADDTIAADTTWNITTKVGAIVNSLTTTERDALSSAPNGGIIYNETDGEFQVRQGGSWVTLSSGSTQPDASETVAGKVELATNAEMGTATSTGTTGARLIPPNDQLVKTSSGAGDENKLAVLDASGNFAAGFIDDTANATGTEIGQLSGTTNIAESDTFFGATDITGAEAETLTDGSEASLLHLHAKGVGLIQRVLSVATGTLNVAHGLGVAPQVVFFKYSQDQSTGGTYLASTLSGHHEVSGTVDQTIGHIIGAGSPPLVQDITNASISFQESASNGVTATVSAVDATNFTISFVKVGSPVSTLNILWEAFA